MASCTKIAGAPAAVGYWGSNMRCRIEQEQTLPKMRALLQDQLLGGGIKAALWLSVHDIRDGVDFADPGTIRCTCVKASGEHADRRCLSCHGIGFVPGYRKFGYETIWAASVSSSLITTGVALNTVLKPYRYELSPTAIYGRIETPDVFFVKNVPGTWEARNDYTIKDSTTSGIEATFSIDGGLSWAALEDIAIVNPPTGRIKFRIELRRTSVLVPSPAWEIVRARFASIPEHGPRDSSGNYRLGPWILILKSISPDKEIQDLRGVQIDSQSNNFWTGPLSMFDCSVPTQSGPGGYFDESNTIRDPSFIEFLEGARNAKYNQRWSLTNQTYSDPMGYMVRQFFQARLTQLQEFTHLVF